MRSQRSFVAPRHHHPGRHTSLCTLLTSRTRFQADKFQESCPMKNWSKFVVLGAVLAASTSFAFADEIDLSGPGTFIGGIYIPVVAIPPTSQFDVTLETGIFT